MVLFGLATELLANLLVFGGRRLLGTVVESLSNSWELVVGVLTRVIGILSYLVVLRTGINSWRNTGHQNRCSVQALAS
jgi:hypothetical protein